eukprot:1155635-Pelagomonas_calceolata.AAC.26
MPHLHHFSEHFPGFCLPSFQTEEHGARRPAPYAHSNKGNTCPGSNNPAATNAAMLSMLKDLSAHGDCLPRLIHSCRHKRCNAVCHAPSQIRRSLTNRAFSHYTRFTYPREVTACPGSDTPAATNAAMLSVVPPPTTHVSGRPKCAAAWGDTREDGEPGAMTRGGNKVANACERIERYTSVSKGICALNKGGKGAGGDDAQGE